MRRQVRIAARLLGLAVILTGFVCWIFLGSLSSTLNVLFAIPMSLLGTIAEPMMRCMSALADNVLCAELSAVFNISLADW